MNRKVTVAVVGLGGRGGLYSECQNLYSDEMEIVACADIVPEKVEKWAKKYNIPKERCYSSAEELLKEDRLADVLFICTQDRQHVPHAVPALEKGYHLLLEKPISPDPAECKRLADLANKYQRHVVVCHVLRYTPFYQKIKEIIDSGVIGDIVSIQAIENVAYWHQAHSFVRGNWRNSNTTSPMALQKCCHDMDLFVWLTGKKCKRVSSFGSLTLFKEERAPEGSTLRCLDGCKVKDTCPFDAEAIYITGERTGMKYGKVDWMAPVLAVNPTEENVRHALETGPYGRCVYHCDNNVVDHQVMNLEMEDGSTINFTMCAFTNKTGRAIKIMGTMGDIEANNDDNIIDVCKFAGEHEVIDVNTLATNFSGHGGGDIRLVKDILDLVRDESSGSALTSIDQSTESHFIALALEESRQQNGKVIEMDEFVANIK